ncbi:MAG: hypothetical protein J3K34DRAFT_290332 [Monoraphidium minutum]|nr:MAG: hypothetical protein J3K34DRAFT_290332 [Monoraphidium minutum]
MTAHAAHAKGAKGGGKPKRKFRPHGAPAGVWPHQHWSHCVFHDPYERVNFWSHAVPGAALLAGAAAAAAGTAPGGPVLALFCACAAVTHCFSALTHVWPDSHGLEKLDHFGIVALILGTPVTQLMAVHPHGDTTCMAVCGVALLVAALLRPLPRTLGFLGVGAVMVFHYTYIIDASLAAQIVLYIAGAAAFISNGGHERLPLLMTDHHILHYTVTVACAIHVWNLLRLEAGGIRM